MKVQVLNLEAEDDLASTRDKLGWTKAERAVLVWPRRGQPLSSRIDLALVQRHARRRGIELGLITFEHTVLANAARLGIPVFDSLAELPSGKWTAANLPFRRRSPERLADLRAAREAASPKSLYHLDRRGRVAVLTLVGAAALALIGTVVPSAEVYLKPQTSELTRTVHITVDPLNESGPAEDRIHGRPITTEVSGEMQIDVTGSVRQPSTTAEGQVVFVNLTEDELNLPSGTGVRAGEARFFTLEKLTLPAGLDSTAAVAIAAAQPGIAGNVPAGTIDTVEGPAGFLVQVSNPLATRGGRDVRALAASAEDLNQLWQLLSDELVMEAETLLSIELGPEHMLVPGSLLIKNVLEEQFDRAAGEAANSVSLLMTVEVEGLSFAAADAEQAIELALAGSLSGSRFIVPGSLTIQPVDAAQHGGAAQVELRVSSLVATRVDASTVGRLSRGASTRTIGARLQKVLNLAEPAQVTVQPSWLPWMPWLEMRIDAFWAWESD